MHDLEEFTAGSALSLNFEMGVLPPANSGINKHGRRLIYLNPADTEGTIIEYCAYPEEQ